MQIKVQYTTNKTGSTTYLKMKQADYELALYLFDDFKPLQHVYYIVSLLHFRC